MNDLENTVWSGGQDHAIAAGSNFAQLLKTDTNNEVMNSFAHGLAFLLRQAGCDTDYTTAMGDLGQAFVIQGVEYDEALTGGYADIGWWPLDRWQIEERMGFLSDVNGCALYHYKTDFDSVITNPAGTYRKHFESAIQHEVIEGRSPLVLWDTCYAVAGYDTSEPPLLVWCLVRSQKEPQIMRIKHYPCAICMYGNRFEPMDRLTADAEALAHAVRLGHGITAESGTWRSGEVVWKSWEKYLMKNADKTEARWHANVRLNLLVNRRAAIIYLQDMICRHGSDTGTHLHAAIDCYHRQLEYVEAMNTEHAAIIDPGTDREKLASLIRDAAKLDAEAIDALESAVRIMQKQD